MVWVRSVGRSRFMERLPLTFRAIHRYKKEVLRLIAEVSLGSGALAVIGGTVWWWSP